MSHIVFAPGTVITKEWLNDADSIINGLVNPALHGFNQFALSVGGSSGNSTLTGTSNTGLGFQVLASLTTGLENVGIGGQAFVNLTTGFDNVGVGVSAGHQTTSGNFNTYVGFGAGYNNITGIENTLIGNLSGENFIAGSNNVAFGAESLRGNLIRDWCQFNTFAAGLPHWILGAAWSDGGGKATKGIDGTSTLVRNSDGDTAPKNVMAGLAFTVTFTVLNYTTGSVTASVGGISDVARSSNGTFSFSGTTSTTDPLTFTPTNTSRFSINNVSMFMTTTSTGSSNVSLGPGSMFYNVTGNFNVAIGNSAMQLSATGSRNIAIGNFAGQYNSASDRFIVNNRDQTSEALDITNSILYGVMDAATANQTLLINAGLVTISGALKLTAGSTGIGRIAFGANTLFFGGIASFRDTTNSFENFGIADSGAISSRNSIAPGTDAGAAQTVCHLFAGTGVPNNANGINGDFYFRSDGTVAGNNVQYHKEAGAWVAFT